jgi:hypothetical protein
MLAIAPALSGEIPSFGASCAIKFLVTSLVRNDELASLPLN